MIMRWCENGYVTNECVGCDPTTGTLSAGEPSKFWEVQEWAAKMGVVNLRDAGGSKPNGGLHTA